MNDWLSVVPLALVLCLGIFAQAASGFAAGLLIVTTLVWFGYPIPEAQSALIVATIPQNLWGVWKFREFVDFKQLAWPASARVLALPVGFAMLHSMESLSTDVIKQIVGATMLGITISICVIRPEPRERLAWGWGALAFPLSGFLQGLVGMGGPAMVLWVQAHDWDTRRSRGFLFSMYLASIVPAMLILYFTFGDRIIKPAIVSISLTPILLLVTSLGLRSGTWLGRERLRRVTLAILLLMGVVSVAAPVFRYFNPGTHHDK